MKTFSTYALTILILAGCAQVQFTRKDEAKPTHQEHKFLVSQLVWGFTPLVSPPAPNALCANSRIETVQINLNTIDVLLSTLTLGFYVPQRVVVQCQ